MRGPGSLLAVSLAFLVAGAAPASTETGPWLGALSNAFVVMDLQTGDLDGDGKDETVVCYREDLSRSEQIVTSRRN